MTTQEKAQQPQQDDQELTDDNLDQVSGGRVAPVAAGVGSELEAPSLLFGNEGNHIVT